MRGHECVYLVSSLQEVGAIDTQLVGQMLGHLASVLRSSDMTGAVDRIGMAELKARLMRRPRL